MKQRYHNDPEFRKRMILANYKSSKKIREKIIALLGSKCSNPNCLIPRDKLDPRCLQIDHVHGGGTKERKQFSNCFVYYRYILRQIKLGSKDYQLLCVYCNWMKSFENNKNVHGHS